MRVKGVSPASKREQYGILVWIGTTTTHLCGAGIKLDEA